MQNLETPNETSPETSDLIAFDADLLLLGYMAVEYAKRAPTCPVRHWASTLTNSALRLGPHQYVVSWKRREGKRGLWVTKHIDKFRGGENRKEFFIAEDDLHNLKVVVKGEWLT